MTDRTALLAAVLAAPDDDAPRLVYADWLDENGEPERAEFIRVQIARARCPNRGLGLDECKACDERQARELELLRTNTFRPPMYLADYGWPCIWPEWIGTRIQFDCANLTGNRLLPNGRPSALFARGFVHSITCTAADWLAHADQIVAEHPVREVKLTTWPEAAFGRERAGKDGYQYVTVHLGSRSVEIRRFSADTPEEHGFDAVRALWPAITFYLPTHDEFPHRGRGRPRPVNA